MEYLIWIVIYALILITLFYNKISLFRSTLVLGGMLFIQSLVNYAIGSYIVWGAYIVFALLFNVPFLKRMIVKALYPLIAAARPKMSSTEAEALNAGDVGYEGELFSGAPNFDTLLSIKQCHLTKEEQAFLDGPVERLCEMLNDFKITFKDKAIPKEVMRFLAENGFWGMIIPKQYGGLAFSAYAHSEVIIKIASASATVATVASVPNSLGPSELLLKYGTKQQQDYYLPRLARGLEIPCFALTSLQGGSDAAAMRDSGIVCKRTYEGKETLGILLNFDKRYITLAPIATLFGLAFKCYDPDGLLGGEKDLGITCALIPDSTEGIEHGSYHYPLNMAFQNGPIKGKDVFIPLDFIIGGKDMIGSGWRMLMECLAAGRAISLPSVVLGGSRKDTLGAGAYVRSRRQFNTAIANFQGVQEALAEATAFLYIMESTRLLSLSQLDDGLHPPVISGICKRYITDMARQISLHVMDIFAGKGICMGPSNFGGNNYQSAPVSITVEGANILTRSLIIFGQGAIRCHKYMMKLFNAKVDSKEALIELTDVIFGFLGNIGSNITRSLVISITGGYFIKTPDSKLKRYYQKVARYSASFAYLSDVCMVSLGSKLKFMESLSGRFADCLAMMYMATAVLKNYHDQGEPEEQIDVVVWALDYLCNNMAEALEGIIQNYPNRILSVIRRLIVFPLGNHSKKPTDAITHNLIKEIIKPSKLREFFAKNLYMKPNDNNLMGMMCSHLDDLIAVEPLISKFNKAVKRGKLEGYTYDDWMKSAVEKGVLTEIEANECKRVESLRTQFNNVDCFPKDFIHTDEP